MGRMCIYKWEHKEYMCAHLNQQRVNRNLKFGKRRFGAAIGRTAAIFRHTSSTTNTGKLGFLKKNLKISYAVDRFSDSKTKMQMKIG